MGSGDGKESPELESATQNFSVMRTALREVCRVPEGATQHVRWYPFWFVFSLEKRDGGDTHPQFGRTKSLPGGEGHHQPRQHRAQKLSWGLGQPEKSPCR